ncbi:fluoride efflux transporter CrcB [Albirhodobacter sp. R86504]|uniref:fluoride efflux transporter CrcB n=1 Tax=Albirhodobacter sp. R86504 TaxID=3093848 RepID=UPI00366E5311
MIQTLIPVALGGAIGASLRYGVNVAAPRLFGHGFPFATLTVNVLGSFLMGLLVVILAHKTGTRYAPFWLTGVLGGFTTFSAFSLDAITLYERGQMGFAFVYVAGTVIVALAAVFLGMTIAREWFA